MPIPGLPTFAAGILMASQLNAIISALEAKFKGQISAGDIAWPFVAGGDIDMANFQLLHVGKFWNAYNVAERTAGSTFQSVIDALETDGGGVVMVPGNYDETLPAAGITVPANVVIMGAGNSSILRINSSASAAMITLGGSSDNAAIRNLRLAGRSTVNQSLVDLNGCDDMTLHGVHFDTHGTSAYVVARGGGNNLQIGQCLFAGNGDAQVQDMLQINAFDNVRVVGNTFSEWSNSAILANPTTAAITNVIIGGNAFLRETSTNAVMTRDAAINLDNSGAVASCENVIVAENVIGGGGAGVAALYVDDFDTVIVDNNAVRATSDEPAMLFVDVINLVIHNNSILCQDGDGIVVGATNGTEELIGSRTALICTQLTVSQNRVHCTGDFLDDTRGIPLVLVAGASLLDAAVNGNRLTADRANIIQVWNLVANPTTRPTGITLTGNFTAGGLSTTKGFAAYTDMGGTNSGNIGSGAVSHWFTMVGNQIPNTVSGTDYTHNATNKCIVQNNNE